MQNKYVGDVGDFGKYGLLRTLAGLVQPGTRLRVGVVWYLTQDDDQAGGTLDSYLRQTSRNERLFGACDQRLYKEMGRIRKERHVAAVESAGILGQDARFFRDLLLPQTDRASWLRGALDAVEPCALILLDPDNGIRPQERKGQSVKHAYLTEVQAFARVPRQSVVVYHHLGRQGRHRAQIDEWLAVLRRTCPERRAFALWYHRGTARAYFVLPAQSLGETLLERARVLVASRWGEGKRPHFELVTEN